MEEKKIKRLHIGDIHMHDSWKKIVENEDWDEVIFYGDYVDSFSIKPEKGAKNLEEILNFKRENPDKVILLWGNHDHSYLFGEMCSGYNPYGAQLYIPLLRKAFEEELFHLYYIFDDVICSHAGVTQYWLQKVAEKEMIEDLSWDDVIQKKAGYPKINILNWNCIMGYNGYGDTISNSLIWTRPKSLLENKLGKYRQIVGHTHFKEPYTKDGIYFNDMMPHHYIISEGSEIKFIENKYVRLEEH